MEKVVRLAAALVLCIAGSARAASDLPVTPHTHECFLYTTSCGATVDGEITIFGCRYVDNNDTKYWTRYRFPIPQQTDVGVTVTSTEFIPELGIAIKDADVYAAYNANGSRRNTISLGARLRGPNFIDVDIYAKSPYTGRFRMTISCAVCAEPQFTQHPVSMSVPFGGQASLSAEAVGNEPIEYSWYDAADPSHALGFGRQFQSPPITRTSSFYAEASNGCGRTRSVSAIIEPGPCEKAVVQIPTANYTIGIGSRLTLNVGVRGSAPITLQWYQGLPPDTGAPIDGATSTQLTLPSVMRSSSYWVRVTNACGVSDSAPITVNVVTSPRRRSVRH